MLAIARSGAVLRLVLDRPAQRNALSEELIAALRQELAAAARDPAVRLVVISANGPSFCAGADASWLKALTARDAETWGRATRAVVALFVEMMRFEKPLIARLHGHVVGAGVALAACCDHVICTDTTQFRLPELRLGMAPSVVTPFLVARLGPAMAKTLLMSEPTFGPERALSCGLAQLVVSADAVEAAEAATVEAMLTAPAAAVAEFKQLFLALTLPDLDRQAELAFACAQRTLQEHGR